MVEGNIVTFTHAQIAARTLYSIHPNPFFVVQKSTVQIYFVIHAFKLLHPCQPSSKKCVLMGNARNMKRGYKFIPTLATYYGKIMKKAD